MRRCLIMMILLAVFIAVSQTESGAQKTEQISDLLVESQLTTAYSHNEHLSPLDIKVAVKDGVATLSGTVENSVEKDLAGEIAKGVKGVEKIKNNIEIRSQDQAEPSRLSGYMDAVNDAAIAAKIKSNLLWNKHTDGLDIRVDMDNGVATLTGTVKHGIQRDLAVQIAKNTSGVRRVVDELTIDPDAPGVSETISESVGVAAEKAGQAVNDAWITSKVKTVLTFSKNAKGTSIDVSTQKGVVTLSGTVATKSQKQFVVDLANDVVNVKSVVDKLKVSE